VDQNFTFTRVFALEDGTQLEDLEACKEGGACKVIATATGTPIAPGEVNPNFRRPTAYQAPRSIRLGAKISF
jgi:hypothetical protein